MADVTVLLQRIDDGDPGAAAELLPLVYAELHGLAAAKLAHQRAGHTLQATALVNEAWMRLAHGAALPTFQGREHFLRTAAMAMRQVLVDHARRALRAKRGGGAEREPLEGLPLSHDVSEMDILEIDDALKSLEEVDPELAQLVVLRYFGGYPMPEVAQLTGVSLSTAERRWRMARAWLRQSL